MNLSLELMITVHRMLREQNLFIRTLRAAFRSAQDTITESIPLTVELQYGATSGFNEIAVIVRIANIQDLTPRSVFMTRYSTSQALKLSILSHHYEPVRIPDLFSLWYARLRRSALHGIRTQQTLTD